MIGVGNRHLEGVRKHDRVGNIVDCQDLAMHRSGARVLAEAAIGILPAAHPPRRAKVASPEPSTHSAQKVAYVAERQIPRREIFGRSTVMDYLLQITPPQSGPPPDWARYLRIRIYSPPTTYGLRSPSSGIASS